MYENRKEQVNQRDWRGRIIQILHRIFRCSDWMSSIEHVDQSEID